MWFIGCKGHVVYRLQRTRGLQVAKDMWLIGCKGHVVYRLQRTCGLQVGQVKDTWFTGGTGKGHMVYRWDR